MATYVTKRCPHCKHTYQFLKSGGQRKYGCPHQICTNCGRSYWDFDIVEPALYGYENSYEAKEGMRAVISFIITIIMAGIFLLTGIISFPW